jgi:ligand-binding sensor domain-containing protein/two-component sensor histidine kinase
LLRKALHIILLLLSFNLGEKAFGQYPHYFSYDDENGMPSDKVFSMLQDSDGFIWIRYHRYQSSQQKSKSITGLTISSSNKIYCFNFQAQLFVVENDSLKELQHDLPRIIGLSSDKEGNVYISHWAGLAVYNETNNTWKNLSGSIMNPTAHVHMRSTKCITGSLLETIPFIERDGFGEVKGRNVSFHKSKTFNTILPDSYVLEVYQNAIWMFSRENNEVFSISNNEIKPVNNLKLNAALFNKKVTAVKALPDGDLWICTYNGVFCFNPEKDKIELYFPDLSFSDCFIDVEGNYWLSTLQKGAMRVPNLHLLTWSNMESNRLSKITTDGVHIFFAADNGMVGRLNTHNNQLSTFKTSQNADIQSLDYDTHLQALRFNINNRLFTLKGNKILGYESRTAAIKSLLDVPGYNFAASSHGTFINDVRIDERWSREFERINDSLVWAATNGGLLKFCLINDQWKVQSILLNDVLILSIDYDKKTNTLYAVDFKGNLYSVFGNDEIKPLPAISSEAQPRRIRYYDEKIYAATNNGIHILDLKTNLITQLNSITGLVSDNIPDLVIVDNNIWMASSKGLQKIPLNQNYESHLRARLFLKHNFKNIDKIELNHDSQIFLKPEVSCYSSYGKYEIAYRLNKQGDWIRLPSSIENIELQNLPWGKLTIEVKVIDYLNRDSENTIVFNGYVNPPLWRTWWFTLLWALVFIGLVTYVALTIVRNVRKREQERSELAKSQLTALKAQMNPHFMYNTLNSIQALILKQDIKSSNLYLSKFSQLMRKVLDASGRENITLQEDIQILELYLSLEKLRFGSEFNYFIEVDPLLDPYMIQIPPLILQPFAENALKHGLLHKVGDKKLYIRYTLQRDMVCTIEDNGIGRKRAMEIKNRQHDQHESFSSDAIRKRLDLLQSVTNRRFEIKYEDLHTASLAAGTKVIVRIPIPPDME